ncbi:MAG TPA: hypothetical protein P5254_12605 [Aquihabitans sp.]|nr:hypothetical protein [Aquihabitans sp.]
MRKIGMRLVAVAAIVVLVGPVEPTTSGAAAPAPGTLSGTVYFDLDSDGRRDAGEPGVANVILGRLGTSTVVTTGPSGAWSITLPAGATTLTALTGWLPSACPGDLHCAAGRTRDQDFAVENQFVRLRTTVPSGGTIGALDLGLEPDYGDPTGRATSLHSGNDRGDGKARAHDLAARNSMIGWYAGCADPDRTRVCPVGTTLSASGQIYNQGTAWVSGIAFVVTVPPGTVLSADPVLDRSTPGPKPARTGRTGPTADGGTWIEFSLGRALPPAAAVYFRTSYRLTGGPMSPVPYGTGRNYDRKAYVSISKVVPAEDDSPLRVDPRTGRDAGHNVNWPAAKDDDTSDAVEWNVG